MVGIADFLDSLIGGFDLMCFSLVVGGLFWGIFMLRPWQSVSSLGPSEGTLTNVTLVDDAQKMAELYQKTITLLTTGAFWLLGAQIIKLILKVWLMAVVLGHSPFPAFAETTQFMGGLLRAVFTLILALYCQRCLHRHPFSRQHWITAALMALPMIIAGAWLVHAAGRFDNQAIFMSLTVIHQVAAAAWIGGVFQLLLVWHLHKHKAIAAHWWPYLLRRFSGLGVTAIALILMSGLPMAFYYIDTWNGFFGTGYGNLLGVKIILLGLALAFAGLNRQGVHQYQVSGNDYVLCRRVPFYVEAEAAILIALLFTAASLASQPPAIDIPNLTASWEEVVNAFAPRWPRIHSPSHQALIAGEAGRVAIVGQIPSSAATEWSDYNHNISGIFLTSMSFFAMVSYLQYLVSPFSGVAKVIRISHYWPLGFVALGVFLFFRSDAETWPLGPIGFWESTFNNGEVLQHRIATLLVFVLGMVEMRARISNKPGSYLPYVFPVLAGFGGIMLLTHSHIGFQAKSAFLIQIGHTLMGVLSLMLACGRWLELTLDKPAKDLAGFISVAALFQIGLILLFYREPIY